MPSPSKETPHLRQQAGVMAEPLEGIDMAKRSQPHRHINTGNLSTFPTECCYPTCRDRSIEGAPVPLCARHLRLAYEYASDAIREFESAIPKKVDLQRAHPIAGTHQPVVYYLLFGDRVKIGTTINIKIRLREIPYDRLLAIEPGGHQLERLRHQQFSALRITGEWFQDRDPLTQHIIRLRNTA